jgi:fatty acid desaturase
MMKHGAGRLSRSDFHRPQPTADESVATAEHVANVSSHGVTLDAELHARLHQTDHRTIVRFVCFLGFYIFSAALVLRLQGGGTSTLAASIACIPLYLIAAGSLHGISLFTHEAVHGVLSPSPAINRLMGIACALPVWQNYSAYKVLHLRHHKHLGHDGDPDHYDNYSNWTWLVFLMHWVRLVVGYPIYIVMIPILGFRQGKPSDRRWILAEVALLLLLIAAVLASPLSWNTLLHAWLIPMLIINTFVNVRGMSQHTFLEQPDDPVQGTRSILTNRITEFFMCNENYHLEHHLFPRVPWYNLKQLHGELRQQLVDRDAPFVHSYFEFVCEFVRKSWGRSPLGRRRSDVAAGN